MIYPNGSKSGQEQMTYEGEWKDGEENGQGKMEYPDGGELWGEWMDGKRSGWGKYRWSPDCDVYEGV